MDENKINNEVEQTEEVKQPEPVDVQKLVNDEVAKAIKNIKGNLNNAYAERDAAKEALAEAEKAKRQSEIDALEKAGKHREVQQMQIDELTNKLKTYEAKNTELSRDNILRSKLSALDFKNEKASKMAYADLVGSLKQDATGAWVHESGVSMDEAIQAYSKSDDNQFMFSVKQNAGTGQIPANPATGDQPVKSIKDMSQEEVLKAIQDGKLTPKGNWDI